MLLPVAPPYRLDFTAEVLRRLSNNAVDVLAADGTYYRALADASGANVVRVRQRDPATLEVSFTGRDGRRWLPRVTRMLGTDADLREWLRRSRRIGWVNRLAGRFAGVRPPRYASAWEACAHAIVFAQISIFAAAAIMQRLLAALGEPIAIGAVRTQPFPAPEAWLAARDADLLAAGLSRNKLGYLREAARAALDGRIDDAELEALPTEAAAARIAAVRGLGPWSAAIVMLRGFGRIDTFPLRDSGVARSATQLAGVAQVDLDRVLSVLGPTRGMLYYHLLLGRLHPE